MMRFLTTSMLFVILLATSGCTTAAVAVLDEKISQMTDMECTTVNIMFGDDYCRDKVQEIKQDPVYCYRSLGGVNCYSAKEPYTKPSARVREVSALGSTGAKVEYVSQKKETGPIFNWSFFKNKQSTAKLD